MEAITTATLLALANIDRGTIVLPLDEAIYPEVAVQTFVSQCGPHCRATVQRADGVLHLELIASDPPAARIQIGNALTELMQCSLRERQ